jgi:hypothetical protein
VRLTFQLFTFLSGLKGRWLEIDVSNVALIEIGKARFLFVNILDCGFGRQNIFNKLILKMVEICRKGFTFG